MEPIVFIDSEINPENGSILDLGAVKTDDSVFHSKSQSDFSRFVSGTHFICGHNIIDHDLKYVGRLINNQGEKLYYIDTLSLSPLLFPNKPYHKLLKDDKLQSDELNNPLNDSIKAKELFYDELNAFEGLSLRLQGIYSSLLHDKEQFSGFFTYVNVNPSNNVKNDIKEELYGKVCHNADISMMIKSYPIELAYALALIRINDRYSITPPWVHKKYPQIENVMKLLRNTPCPQGCEYCSGMFDARQRLKSIFGYDSFRTYDGEPLQEKAAEAAVHGKSLLAIFPTGGGKSITFQLPAFIAGDTARGLTVVISPLQSLMKDQVDNLEKLGIADAVTINGLLSSIERADAIERVANGLASILYLSPESLRSKSIEKLLLSRNVVRFVIDEAHCFSAWGQDFRVDYMYIGDFIRKLQEKKNLNYKIPVSCFTATAKQKVISDIREYFKDKLGLELELYTTSATRNNLHYAVIYKGTDEEKYTTLRNLIEQKDCPTIVYVSRTRRTVEIASKLTADGFPARPFNGKMESSEKVANQEDFINNRIKIIVATSAFGMGVDKKDVKLVVHYDISDSLENYVQEAGRAGRDQSIEAECYVLFNDEDLDKHFILLNQTKLSVSEIQQVWKAIKDLTRFRPYVSRSALEIARQAGWSDSGTEVETKVKTAIFALENAGYIERGMNTPRVYATSILAHNMAEAAKMIEGSIRFNEKQKDNSKRIIKSLISSRSVAKAGNDDAESRVDYLADILAMEKSDVIEAINLMREEGLLADDKDMSAYIWRSCSQSKSKEILAGYSKLERYMISILDYGCLDMSLKEINEDAVHAGVSESNVKDIKKIKYFWTIKSYIQKSIDKDDRETKIDLKIPSDKLSRTFEKRVDIASFIIDYLYDKSSGKSDFSKEHILVEFSLLELQEAFENRSFFGTGNAKASLEEIEDALLYLSKIDALDLEGGFLVLYQAMEIRRLVLDNKIRYKNEDYRKLNEYYKQKIQQIHIVGEYANMMVRDYNEALQFVNDYFQMDYKQFIAKYFKGTRTGEINRNITPKKYKQIFGELSEVQSKIINDDESKNIVVPAGPGSGKTRVLVHKLASLILLEDIKYEQLLMLTFSRAAATEFKRRLIELIGNAAKFVEIKTFHSYCFDILGKIGNIQDSENVVKNAVQMIRSGKVERSRITKTVLVIDEAQDMDGDEFSLVQALMECNDNMRVIAVGDDDQNIYEFRGSDSKFFNKLITDYEAVRYEMVENYRSKKNIVELSNAFAAMISQRMKRTPIAPTKQDSGAVKLIKHVRCSLEVPVVQNIKEACTEGTTCVLTGTNDEVLRVMGLLINNGICAKLIHTNDGFNMYNLIEIRYFLKRINNMTRNPVISDEIWNSAKVRLEAAYKNSSCLEVCLKLIEAFENTNKTKYKTDFEEFIYESKYEDFVSYDQNQILVATIHKSKGREFDNVFMMLDNYIISSDAAKRIVYVGMTRAKDNLYIHYNNSTFDRFNIKNVEHIYDKNIYPEANEVILQLSHKDVYLDYFKSRQELVCSLRSGEELSVEGDYMYVYRNSARQRVLKFSNKFIRELKELADKGYSIYKAVIRFIVVWKDQEDGSEAAIILPDVYLKKGL